MRVVLNILVSLVVTLIIYVTAMDMPEPKVSVELREYEMHVKLKNRDVQMPQVASQADLKRLADAMIIVESQGNDSAYNPVEDAVGCLQIRRIMVREVNRLLELNHEDIRYQFEDRWDRDKSIEMFNIFVKYTWKDGQYSYEEIARCWNGGPDGCNENGTISYWNKVQNEIKDA